MELMCESCGAVIQIPAERVPQNSTFRVTCPRCKGKISASTKTCEVVPVGAEIGASSHLLALNEVKTGSRGNEFLSLATGASLSDHPSALLCIDHNDRRANFQSMIESLGFRTDAPISPDQALQRLHFSQYSLILLEDIFSGKCPNPVAAHLAGLTMSIRREILVILIGERWRTGEPLEAFLESVDLVFHPADLGQLAPILARAFSDHQRFYKVFNECLIEAGKKLP